MIELQLQEGAVAPGEPLRGRLTGRTESGKAPRAFVVEVGWRTEGRGKVDRHEVASVRLEPRGTRGEIDGQIEIPLPAGGPVSYDGDLVRIIWELRVRLDIPWGRDETVTRVFRVACRAR